MSVSVMPTPALSSRARKVCRVNRGLELRLAHGGLKLRLAHGVLNQALFEEQDKDTLGVYAPTTHTALRIHTRAFTMSVSSREHSCL
jgi:hypothetical protein